MQGQHGPQPRHPGCQPRQPGGAPLVQPPGARGHRVRRPGQQPGHGDTGLLGGCISEDGLIKSDI